MFAFEDCFTEKGKMCNSTVNIYIIYIYIIN